MRTNEGLCEAVWMVSELSVDSATETSGSSGVCITCWVRQRCSNTRSAAVTTRCTPPTAWAALTSRRLILPCATLLRKILPHSMPGRRRLWTYSARPVTFSQDSRRGSERPTCGVSAGLSARFMEGAPEIDANQLLLVGRRAVQVAFDLHLLRGGLFKQLLFELPAAKDLFHCRQPGRPVGRGADHHARLANRIPLEIERNRYSHRGPVVGRARGAFEIGRAPAPERRHFEQRDQLVEADRGFQVTGAEFLDRDAALAGRSGDRDAGAERA